LQLGTSTVVTAVLDEDNMASNSPTSLATQQSIKAYVDSQIGAFDTLAEVLANGNTSGANDVIVTAGQKITVDTIDETTVGSGVTIDSVLLKDDVVNATDIETGSISANDGTTAATIANSTGIVTVPSAVLTTADINGGTADGVIIGGSTPAAATVTTVTANTSLNIAGTVTVTSILDEDNMSSNDPAGLATQQSIKTYVDGQVGGSLAAANNLSDLASATTALTNLGLTATAAELNIMDGVTASTAELNYNDITTLGIVQASKTVTADSNADVKFGDGDKILIGDDADLEIYHDGSSSYVIENGTGSLNIGTNGYAVYINKGFSEVMAQFVSDGPVILYYDNAAKLATTTSGIDVTGTVTMDGATTSADINFGDNDKAVFGAGSDLQLFHDASNSYIKDTGTGNLYIDASNSLYLRDIAGNAFVHLEDTGNGGVVRLYNEGSQKLHTMSTGVNIIGSVLTDGLTSDGTVDVNGTLEIDEVSETVNIYSSTSGTLTFDTASQGVVYASSNQTANRTINFTNVNSRITIGQSCTVSVLMTQGSTAYYLNAYQVDGSAVTPKWSGGSAPTEGNADSLDAYTFTIIKTANATFTVLASQTQFA